MARTITLRIAVEGGEAGEQTATRLTNAFDKTDAAAARAAASVSAVGNTNPFAKLDQQAAKAVGSVGVLNKDLSRTAAVADDLLKGANSLGAGVKDLGTGTDSTAASMAALDAAGGPVGIVIGIIGAAALVTAGAVAYLTREAWEQANAFAQLGVDVGKMMEETHLAAETVSALKAQMDLTGTSQEDLNGGIKNYIKLIGDANNGSDEARAKMARLRVDWKDAGEDFDGAFKKALITIQSLPPGVARTNAAIDAFGDNGVKLLAFLDSFHGNVDELVKKMDALGVVMSSDDVKAAQEFQQTLKELEEILKGTGLTVGREFGPVFKDVLGEIRDLFKDNKTEIKEWAQFAADAFRGTIVEMKQWAAWVEDNWYWIRPVLAVATSGTSEMSVQMSSQLKTSLNTVAKNGGSYRSQQSSQNAIDAGEYVWSPNAPASTETRSYADYAGDINKAQEEAEKLRKEREAQAKAELSAQIALVADQIKEIEKIYDEQFKGFEDGYKETMNAGQFQANWDALKQWYGEQINTLVPIWNELVRKQTLADKQGNFQRLQVYEETQQHIQALAQKTNEKEAQAQKLLTDIQKKTDADQYKQKVDSFQRYFELQKSLTEKSAAEKTNAPDGTARQVEILRAQIALGEDNIDVVTRLRAAERALLVDTQQEKLKELAQELFLRQQIFDITTDPKHKPKAFVDLESTKAAIKTTQSKNAFSLFQFDQDTVVEKKRVSAQTVDDLLNDQTTQERLLGDLQKQNADAQFVAQRRKLAAEQEEYGLRQQIAGLEDQIANAGKNDALIIEAAHLQDILDLRKQELNAVIAINRAQLQLSHAMDVSTTQIKAIVLEHLAAEETLNQGIANGINKTYDFFAAKLDENIDKLFEWAGKWKDAFSFITEPLKAVAHNALSNLTEKVLDAFIPELGSQYEKAKNPVVGELKDHTKLLREIANNTAIGGGAAAGGIGVGGDIGGIGGIAGMLVHAITGGHGISGNQGGFPIAMNETGHSGAPAPGSPDQIGGGSIWDRIKSMFGTGPGGLFAPVHNVLSSDPNSTSKMAGYMSGIGQIAGIAGGIVGGRWGGILSMAGTGMSIGAMFGPWGAAIGAGIGALGGLLMGIFGGNKAQKTDKKENMPKLQQGFTDAMTQLTQLLADTKSMVVDPASAISQADQIFQQISSGFGIQFESKKYSKIAQQQIAQKKADAQLLVDQIHAAAQISKAAGERQRRIIPEFADGGAVSGFAQMNGLTNSLGYRNGTFAGLVPGVYDRKDDFLAKLTGNEVVLTPDVWQPIAPYLKEKKVPGFADGGHTGQGSVTVATGAAGKQNVTIEKMEIHLSGEGDETKVEKVFIKLLGSEKGQNIMLDSVIVPLKKKNKI